MLSSERLCELVAEGMLEKKASDVVILDLRKIPHAIADFFVIGSGNSDTQIDAISDSIQDFVKTKAEQKPWRTEGERVREWILIDYVDVVAHVFNKDKREFFALEELWGDAVVKTYAES